MMSVPERRVPERLTHHAPHTGSGLAARQSDPQLFFHSPSLFHQLPLTLDMTFRSELFCCC